MTDETAHLSERPPGGTPQTGISAQKVTIDGTEYALDSLSENARNQIANLRVTDQEIARLQQQIGIAQTARLAYADALKKELEQMEKGSITPALNGGNL